MNEIKANKKFYETINYFVIKNGITKSRLSIMCDKDSTSLNPSKLKNNRWITMGFFLKICEALKITPQQFFNRMNKIMEEK